MSLLLLPEVAIGHGACLFFTVSPHMRLICATRSSYRSEVPTVGREENIISLLNTWAYVDTPPEKQHSPIMNDGQGKETIARNVHNVLHSFRLVVNATASSLASSSVPSPDSEVKLEDEMTRFKMWCGNLGAHQTGPPSLDHRLREAPHLHDQVIRLLRDLTESLDNVLSVVDPANHPQDNPDATTEAFPSEDSESFPEGLDDTDSEDSFSETSSTSPISTLYDDIKVPVDCLLRLSVAIANPAPHERHRKLGAGKEADVTFREKFDVDYVKDKFPGIAPDLAEALGKSITRRRQFFKYREAHHTRLAEGLETTTPNIAVQEGNQTHDDTGRTEIVPQTVASSLPGHLRSLTEVDPRAGIIDEDLRSDTGISQTSYATSAGFIQDMLSGQTPPPPLRVPPLPAAAESGVFECPLCYRMITASSPSAWK